MVDLHIPTPWVMGDYLPGICSRHGAPATRKTAIAVSSRTPTWAYALIPFLIIFLIVVMGIRTTVPAAAWPFCDECVSGRHKTIALGSGLGVLAVVLFSTSVAVGQESSLGGLYVLLLLLFAGTVVASAVVLARSGWMYVARAFVTPDRQVVTVTAHEAFAAQMQAALSAAAAARTTARR